MDSRQEKRFALNVIATPLVVLMIFFMSPATMPAESNEVSEDAVEAFMESVEEELCMLLCNGVYSKRAVRPESFQKRMHIQMVLRQVIDSIEQEYLGWESDRRAQIHLLDDALDQVTAYYKAQRGYSLLNNNADSRFITTR